MAIPPMSAGLSASTLSAIADNAVDDSVREDMKMNRTRRNNALENHVDAARSKISNQKKASDERLKSAEKKTNGGLFGGIIGSILAIAAIVIGVICICTGVGALVGAALIGLGAALLSAGTAIGGAIGSKAAEGNDKRAEEAQNAADSVEIDEKELEKRSEDIKDQLRANQSQLQQLYKDARARSKEDAQSRQQITG